MFLSTAFVLTSCQTEEEESRLKKLSQEAEEGTFPKTQKESQQLQKEVKKLNVEVKEESQERIKMINKELEKNK
jgi:hypothetical protein